MDSKLKAIKDRVRKLPSPPPTSNYGICSTQLSVPNSITIFPSYQRVSSSFHQRYVFMLCLQPAGTVYVDNNPIYLQPGEAILIFPYQRHSYIRPSNEDIIWLVMTFELQDEGDIHLLRNTPLQLGTKSLQELKRILDSYQQYQENLLNSNEVVLRTACLLNEMKMNQLEAASQTLSIDHQRLIYNVGVFIHDHLDQPFTVADIAEAMNISQSYLHSLFRKATGQSLGRYITSTRIRKAVGLLIHTNMSVTDIAAKCGFISLSSFSRTFRKHAKMSPQAFRQNKRERPKMLRKR